jgi:PAS domain-containing protein
VNFPGREHDQGLAQAILAQAADAIIFADTEGVIRIWNAAAARLRIPASRRSSWLP